MDPHSWPPVLDDILVMNIAIALMGNKSSWSSFPPYPDTEAAPCSGFLHAFFSDIFHQNRLRDSDNLHKIHLTA